MRSEIEAGAAQASSRAPSYPSCSPGSAAPQRRQADAPRLQAHHSSGEAGQLLAPGVVTEAARGVAQTGLEQGGASGSTGPQGSSLEPMPLGNLDPTPLGSSWLREHQQPSRVQGPEGPSPPGPAAGRPPCLGAPEPHTAAACQTPRAQPRALLPPGLPEALGAGRAGLGWAGRRAERGRGRLNPPWELWEPLCPGTQCQRVLEVSKHRAWGELGDARPGPAERRTGPSTPCP